MSGGDLRRQFLYDLPPSVHCEFCRVMDGLLDRDWTRFASEVLRNQTDVCLAERKERRTDWVLNHLGNQNQRVGDLLDALERVQLLRPRNILLSGASTLTPSSLPPPPSYTPLYPPHCDHPLTKPEAPPLLSTVKLSPPGGGAAALPRPAPPPSYLQSGVQAASMVTCRMAVMCWPHEEVHAGTKGFSQALQVGEGGFGVVYRATLRNTDCAVKRLREDGEMDWRTLKDSFHTEVEKLCRFQHPNIVQLLGFSDGGGSVCLIYSYMHNRSLEDQLHNDHAVLPWSQRISILEGAALALQYLHSPPAGQKSLIHGDVKSSNILLDSHMVAKLSDFGLARFSSCGPASSLTATASLGWTKTLRGTLAYLPEQDWRLGRLGTATDVFSFGVVLLEVLTGRRALERDAISRERYLKDLVEELEESPSGSCAQTWTAQLDQRLVAGGDAEPAGCLQVATLARHSLTKKWKDRPTMIQVFDKLKDIHNLVRRSSSPGSSGLQQDPGSRPPGPPKPPSYLDSSLGALTHQLSKLGPLEDTYPSQFSSASSSCTSSFSHLPPPHQLHSPASLPPASSTSLPPLSSSSSFVGPCETDESRGFSQYNLCQSTGTSSRSLPPFTTDQDQVCTGTPESTCCQDPVPTEDKCHGPLPSSCGANGTSTWAITGGAARPDTREKTAAGLQGLSPGRSLQSTSPGPSVRVNPSKQRMLEKTSQYEDGPIQTPELLSSVDLYGRRSFGDPRGPEESDELDYLPARHN